MLEGEPVPKDLFRSKSKCEGTLEDHRGAALDVGELIRKRVFEQTVGTVFRPNLGFPWLRVMRLNSTTLDLKLISGRVVVVPLVLAGCGITGRRMRLQCPLCSRRVCTLYYLEPRLACRVCKGLRYAAQSTSSFGRKALAKWKIRRKLGDHGQLWSTKYPPRPRGMWRRTYARYCAALDGIEAPNQSRRSTPPRL